MCMLSERMDLDITDRCPPEFISRFELYIQDRCANLAMSLGAPTFMPCARGVEPCEAVCKFNPFRSATTARFHVGGHFYIYIAILRHL